MVKISTEVARNIIPYVILSFGALVLLLYALVLTGSASNSPGMPNLFLVSLHKTNGTSSNVPVGNATTELANDMSIRIGYFGMCTSTSSQPFKCSGTYSKDGTAISTSFLPKNDFSTLTLYTLASHIQSKVFPFILAFSGIIFTLSFATILILQQFVKRPATSDKEVVRRWQMKKGFKYLVWISVGLNIAVAAGAQQAAQALQWLSEVGDGNLIISNGSTLLGLQWTIVAFSVMFASGSSVIYNARPVMVKEGGPGVMTDGAFYPV